MQQEAAETIALQALAWMVADADVLGTFLGASGASEADLKANAGNPEFLGSVLDFVLLQDQWVCGFCDSVGLSYDVPMQARMALPGGAAVNWT